MDRTSAAEQAVADHVDTHLVRGGAGRTRDVAWWRTGAPTDELNGVVWLSPSAGERLVRELRERFWQHLDRRVA